MTSDELEPCFFCQSLVDARSVPYEEIVISDEVPQVRRVHVLGKAYLHHACPAHGEIGFWATDNWWACQHPDRILDGNACFDAYCVDCGLRWLRETGTDGNGHQSSRDDEE